MKKDRAAVYSNGIRPFGARDKWVYALGDFGCNMSFALNSYLMLFYTQYIGLSLETWAVIILALKIWDGINDPIMGGLMDALKPGKRGKFKTYIFYGSFVLLVSGALCFLPIPTAPYAVKVLVCVIGYLVWDMSYTVVNVPYGALNAAITSVPTERAQLSTFRSVGAMIANILVMVGLPILIFDKDNVLIGNRIFVIALIMGVAGFICFQLLIKYTVERVNVEPAPDKPREKYNYFRALGGFFKNRAAVGCTLAAIAHIIMFSGLGNANQVLFQSYFKMAQLSGVISLVGFLPSVLLIPFIKPIVKRFGKQEAAAYPLIAGLLAAVAMAVVPISPDMTGLTIWILLSVVVGLSTGVMNMVCWAMVADCIDYHELRTGRREEGTIYATYSLGRKLAQGFGASLIAVLLLAVNYVPELGPDQTAQTAADVRVLVGLIQAAAILIMFIALKFIYNLDKKTVNEMEHKLGRATDEDVVLAPPEE